KVSCPSTTDAGVCSPAAPTTVAATGLSNAVQVEDLAQRAVLAGDAMQDGEHRIRCVRAQPIDQGGIDVALLDLDPDAA
ncbi:MAG TPA: hypothetical protein VIH10_14180, partial [Kribbella sp.]